MIAQRSLKILLEFLFLIIEYYFIRNYLLEIKFLCLYRNRKRIPSQMAMSESKISDEKSNPMTFKSDNFSTGEKNVN